MRLINLLIMVEFQPKNYEEHEDLILYPCLAATALVLALILKDIILRFTGASELHMAKENRF